MLVGQLNKDISAGLPADVLVGKLNKDISAGLPADVLVGKLNKDISAGLPADDRPSDYSPRRCPARAHPLRTRSSP